jgi:FkbM family methyltransferase
MNLNESYGMARSLVMYYGPVWRRRRMARFYGQFLSAGELAFDVGAHVGNRVRCWLGLGARVVAVEPLPRFHRLLQLLYGRRVNLELLECGLADERGEGELLISSRHPTLSTLAHDWQAEVTAKDHRFARSAWDQRQRVELETLDGLIERYGEPAFCKIDVEGFEEQVLRGLSRPLRAMSFEYIPAVRERAFRCVDLVSSLDDYRFRWSSLETMRWATGRWLTGPELKREMGQIPDLAGSGDIYAVRSDGLHTLRPI